MFHQTSPEGKYALSSVKRIGTDGERLLTLSVYDTNLATLLDVAMQNNSVGPEFVEHVGYMFTEVLKDALARIGDDL